MMNNRGFIKTIEALIAIVLLLGLIVFIYSGNAKKLPKTVNSALDAEKISFLPAL